MGTLVNYSPQIFSGASSSRRIGCERKISRDFKHNPRISDSVSWTFFPGLEPRTANTNEKKECHEFSLQPGRWFFRLSVGLHNHSTYLQTKPPILWHCIVQCSQQQNNYLPRVALWCYQCSEYRCPTFFVWVEEKKRNWEIFFTFSPTFRVIFTSNSLE